MGFNESNGVDADGQALSSRLEESALAIQRSRVRQAAAARRLELSREHLATLSERRAMLATRIANEHHSRWDPRSPGLTQAGERAD